MHNATVLVVEDNDVNRELVEDLLGVAGYAVVACPTGEQAMAWLSTNLPDLILMDINLPGEDGLTLTRHIKARPETAGIPVVALTAQAMRGDETRAAEAGCAAYLTKPLDTLTFRDILRRFLRDEHQDNAGPQ